MRLPGSFTEGMGVAIMSGIATYAITKKLPIKDINGSYKVKNVSDKTFPQSSQNNAPKRNQSSCSYFYFFQIIYRTNKK